MVCQSPKILRHSLEDEIRLFVSMYCHATNAHAGASPQPHSTYNFGAAAAATGSSAHGSTAIIATLWDLQAKNESSFLQHCR